MCGGVMEERSGWVDVWRGDGGVEWMCGGVMEERSAHVEG